MATLCHVSLFWHGVFWIYKLAVLTLSESFQQEASQSPTRGQDWMREELKISFTSWSTFPSWRSLTTLSTAGLWQRGWNCLTLAPLAKEIAARSMTCSFCWRKRAVTLIRLFSISFLSFYLLPTPLFKKNLFLCMTIQYNLDLYVN